MVIESEEDKLSYLEDWDSVEINNVTIPAIVSSSYEQELDISGVSREALVRTSDISGVVLETILIFELASYTIKSIQSAGDGLSNLILLRA